MFQLPTAGGKTIIAAEIVRSAREKSKKVLFIVPAIALVDQTVERFYAHGVDEVGVIQAQNERTDWSQPVQVASVQTLQRRERAPEADVVVIDEAHIFFRWFEKFLMEPARNNVPIIGMSATPYTRGLGAYYDDLIIANDTASMIKSGILCPYRVFAPSHPDLNGVHVRAGDYVEGELSDRMSEVKLVADIVSTWQRLASGRATLCFAVDRAHAKHLQKQFEEAGVAAGYQDSYTPEDERRSIKRRFHDRELSVVVSVGTLVMGVDWNVECISMCRPTKSHLLFQQIIGRGLRTAPEKDHLLVLDHSDNFLRLGFIEDVEAMHDCLDDGKTPAKQQAADAIRLPKECPKCSYLKPPRVSLCPNCGFKAEAVSTLEPAKGDLAELKRVKHQQPVPGTKQEIFSGLLHLAQRRGYRPGWAANKFRVIFNVWPRGLSEAAQVPSVALEAWVLKEAQNWARRQSYGKRKSDNMRYSVANSPYYHIMGKTLG